MTAATSTSLSLAVDGNLYWGGLGGEFTLTNNSDTASEAWSFSFVTRVKDFKGWSMATTITENSDGSYLVSLANAAWNGSLAPGQSIKLSFNATSPEGFANSGQLLAEQLFIGGPSLALTSSVPVLPNPVIPNPVMPNPVVPIPVLPTPVVENPVTPTPGLPVVSNKLNSDSGANSGNPGDALWGEQFFASYVDMTLYPTPDLAGLAQKTGHGIFTLAFLQATANGELAWAGIPALAPNSSNDQAVAINKSIEQLRAIGGDVMISLGGANGTSLAQLFAQQGHSAQELATAYAKVVDRYQLNRLDFDIEGSAIADTKANALNSQALAILQNSNPELEVWFTLPVLPQGLTHEGIDVVNTALAAGVDLDGINLMAMDYGDNAAPPQLKSMGAYAIDAANNSFSQLHQLYGNYAADFQWKQLGITPMIGVNDCTSEIFTPADATALKQFASEKGLGMLSMWSIARDNPGVVGQVTATSSGLADPAGSFNSVFAGYGTQANLLLDPIINPNPSTNPNSNTSPGQGSSGPFPNTLISVAATDHLLTANSATAETFALSYAWGRQLTIENFDPTKDVLDLKNFWQEGQQAKLVSLGSNGSKLELDFNNQQVYLPGVSADAFTPAVLQIWKG